MCICLCICRDIIIHMDMYICCICREYTAGLFTGFYQSVKLWQCVKGMSAKMDLNSLESGELYVDCSEDHASDREDPT